MLGQRVKLVIFGVFTLLASGAQAATYVSDHTVGPANISFSLTTDDTLGVLSSANITNYAITIINGANTLTFGFGDSSLYVYGSQLTATATDLLFNFSGAGNSFLVFNRVNGDHYCFETTGCSGVFNSAESFRFGFSSFIGEQRSGVQTIASLAAVSAVPELATWAMLLIGFGGIGVALRSRRRSTSFAQLA